MRYASAYGLVLDSEIPLGDLLTSVDLPVPPAELVTIRMGAVDARSGAHPVYAVDGDSICYSVPNTARFLVRGGREITIEPIPGASERTIRTFLLYSILPMLLHKRGVLPLRGSVVETAQGAIALIGNSGTGKSVLALGCLRAGAMLVSDGTAAVARGEDGGFTALPGLPFLKLWREVIEGTEYQEMDGVQRLRPELEVYGVPFPKQTAHQAAPLKAVFVVSMGEADPPRLTSMSGIERIHSVRPHVLFQTIAHATGAATSLTQVLPLLASSVPVYVIERPAVYRVKPFVQTLFEQLER